MTNQDAKGHKLTQDIVDTVNTSSIVQHTHHLARTRHHEYLLQFLSSGLLHIQALG